MTCTQFVVYLTVERVVVQGGTREISYLSVSNATHRPETEQIGGPILVMKVSLPC